MKPSSSIAENLARLRERIEQAASRAGRRAEEITLVAASKTHPAARIRQAFEAGVRHFGENRLQEWESKYAALAALDATWHMIGHLQGNKASRAARRFHTIDSVHSLELAERLERARDNIASEGTEGVASREAGDEPRDVVGGERLRFLIEVKLDPNPAKSGAREEDLPKLAQAAVGLLRLELRGLMGIPPYFDDPEEARPYFRGLRELRDALCARLPGLELPVLSMGMSHDFEVAIEEGATEVRIGTALFGERVRR